MRLTLRTVLAYVDDQLEPIQAREIGARIAESKEATELVAKIREVIRRRRTGAPELAGPGSGPDPNLVADYLENVLPPGQVFDLERLCQSSDMHLAEIAGCHKILTMVLGQKVDVPEQTRQRMYALGSRKVALPAAAAEAPAPAMTDGIGTPVKSNSAELPDYLRGSRPSRFWPVTLVILIGAAWCGLIATDPSLWPAAEQVVTTSPAEEPTAEVPLEPQPPAVAAAQVSPADADAQAPQALATAQEMLESDAGEANAVARNGTEEQKAPVSVNPPPPADRPEPDPANSLAAATGAKMPAPVKLPLDTVELQPDPDAALSPPTKAAIPILVESTDGPLLRLPARRGEWQPIPVNTSIAVHDEFAVPAPFRGTVGIGGDLGLGLEPETRLRRFPDTADAGAAMAVDRGRVVLQRPPASANELPITFTIGDRDWTVTLLEPGTRCGLEVIPAEPLGPPGVGAAPKIGGGFSVASGRVRIVSGEMEPLEIAAGESSSEWPDAGRPLEVHPGSAIPLWLLPEGTFVTPTAKNLAKLYEKEFQAGQSVLQGIGPVTRDRRASVSELAARTLALIDEAMELVPALTADHQETRIAAIQGIRVWLPRDPAHAAQLAEQLQRHFPATLTDPITRLLWGYGPSDALNVDVSRTLVTQLQHSDLVIRELAFFHITKLTGRRYDYLPMAPVAERKAAVNRWEDHLKRNAGALVSPTN